MKTHTLLLVIGVIVGGIGVGGLGATWSWAHSVKLDAERAQPVQANMMKCRMLTAEDTYQLRVKYGYQVDGKVYVSEKFNRHPGGNSSSSSDYAYWESEEDRFCKAKKVTAYYNPDDPAEAYLVNNDSFPLFYFLYPVSALPLVAGLVLLGISFWQRKQEAESQEDEGKA
jgi:hypothetical protein